MRTINKLTGTIFAILLILNSFGIITNPVIAKEDLKLGINNPIITGYVLDANNSEPISGAQINAFCSSGENTGFVNSTNTDNNGFYTFEVLFGDQYYINASAMDFENSSKILTNVENDEVYKINFNLEPIVNQAPNEPSNPDPEHQEIDVELDTVLS
jgi:5-hydroxyisourate hydrolase-like protein (transthyretin family)